MMNTPEEKETCNQIYALSNQLVTVMNKMKADGASPDMIMPISFFELHMLVKHLKRLQEEIYAQELMIDLTTGPLGDE